MPSERTSAAQCGLSGTAPLQMAGQEQADAPLDDLDEGMERFSGWAEASEAESVFYRTLDPIRNLRLKVCIRRLYGKGDRPDAHDDDDADQAADAAVVVLAKERSALRGVALPVGSGLGGGSATGTPSRRCSGNRSCSALGRPPPSLRQRCSGARPALRLGLPVPPQRDRVWASAR